MSKYLPKHILLLFCFSLCVHSTSTVSAQTPLIDSLNRQIKTPLNDTPYILNVALLAKAWWYVNADSAIAIGKRAAQLAQQQSYANGIARSYNNIGVAYDLKGEYLLSLEYHFKAMRIFDSIGNINGLSVSNNNIGEIFRYSGQYEKALSYYLKSVELDAKTGKHADLGISLNSVAQAYWKLKKYDSAAYYLYNAEKELKADSSNYLFDLMQVWNDLGKLFIEQKEYTKATLYFNKVLANEQKIDNEFQMANAMMGMATVYLAAGNTVTALPLAEEAVKLFQSHDSRLEVRDTKRLIAEIYEKTGNYLQAMIYYKQTEQLADSIFNEGLTRRLATVNFEYQEEKRLAEIAVLKKEKGIIAAQSRYRLFGIIGLVGILAGSILLLLLLTKNSRERKRVNELLQQKNTEIENQAKELKELDAYKNKVLS